MKKLQILAAFLAALLLGGNLYAKIVVESTKGEVAYKKDKQWLPLVKGQVLEEGTKISTGMKSWAVINIENSSVKVGQLTMMKISQNKLTADSQDTLLALKHGSLSARVKRIGTLKTSFKITTPVATSSVRGTWEDFSYGPGLGARVYVPEGTVAVTNELGSSNTVSGNQEFNQGSGSSSPDNLLSNSQSGSLLQIFDPNITEDEKQGNEFSGGDTTDLSGGQGNTFVPNSPTNPVVLLDQDNNAHINITPVFK